MEVGRIIGGKYRLQRAIGEGAMGSVWAAEHDVLGRRVAIKFMRPALEDAQTAAARFVAEAKAAAQIKHRFVVDVFDFGITDEDGVPYMVQELLTGRCLSEVLERDAAWPVADVVRFAAQCLSGLQAVHGSGVVHRDLKPENIFVISDADGRFPKLLDFGISKAASTDAERSQARPSWGNAPVRVLVGAGRSQQLTAVGRTLGTPAYMSPEQLCNARDLDARADLYSMGALLYEWLGGRCPYTGASTYAELHQQIMQRRMMPLATLRPGLDARLCAAITRALEPRREQRFANAAQMREALLATLDAHPERPTAAHAASVRRIGQATQVLLESADDPFRSASDLPRRKPRWKWGAALLAAGALTLALGSVWSTHAGVASRIPVAQAKAKVPAPASTPDVGAQERPATAPQHELPWGVDMPEEPFDQEVTALDGVTRSSTDDDGRPARRTRRATSQRGEDGAAPAQPVVKEANLSSSSSPSELRPKQPKVVRQLDF